MTVFKTQSLLTIVLETGYGSLNAASVTEILYIKPNGTTGSFTATPSGTTLTYPLQNGDIDQVGTWSFQSYIVVGGLKGFGDIVKHFFEKPLQ